MQEVKIGTQFVCLKTVSCGLPSSDPDAKKVSTGDVVEYQGMDSIDGTMVKFVNLTDKENWLADENTFREGFTFAPKGKA